MNALKRKAESLLDEAKAMQEQVHVWEEKEAHWNDLQRRIQENVGNMPHLITLNVGGALFTTTKETLLRIKDTYFHAMLGSGLWKPDAPGHAYFLDLEPTTFTRVVDYLRTGKLSFEGLNGWESEKLQESLDYLEIHQVEEKTPLAWSWDPMQCCSHLLLSHDNSVIKVSTTTIQYKSAMGTAPVTRFRVRLDEFGVSTYVGMSLASQYKKNSWNRGYYLRVSDGSITTRPGIFGSKYASCGFTRGDVVTVRFDAGKIYFEVNGDDLGVAFVVDAATSPTELFPVVTMIEEGEVCIVE
ncbi:Aste57867_11499 [Aphanomyces stellatus]|uniref:Aste57867_11499 protein n=1 Tax=Aphanomyces stellatus TaxID=120398 RepID=A0A485KT56_9STRA|nr:hypothetical protein As57867_011456 [Aphanomyces stellatus]VFT88360.1 Aste57867_11499 [Aphanomyces stellatus]